MKKMLLQKILVRAKVLKWKTKYIEIYKMYGVLIRKTWNMN